MLEDETQQRVQPLITANLVDRMLQSEHNVTEQQLQLNETVHDINILYRTVRRRAGPHPDEPSSSRPRMTDSRAPLPEPEQGLSEEEEGEPQPEDEEGTHRPFNDAASRSRDDSPRLSVVSENFDFDMDAALDVVPYDLTQHQRREVQLRNRLHIMTIESNNMEHYLLLFTQRHRRAPNLSEILTLYERHAPSMEAPGTYDTNELYGTTSVPDGIMRYFIRETSDVFGDTEHTFDTQVGMYRFRNRRIILREDFRLSELERATQIANLYNSLRNEDLAVYGSSGSFGEGFGRAVQSIPKVGESCGHYLNEELPAPSAPSLETSSHTQDSSIPSPAPQTHMVFDLGDDSTHSSSSRSTVPVLETVENVIYQQAMRRETRSDAKERQGQDAEAPDLGRGSDETPTTPGGEKDYSEFLAYVRRGGQRHHDMNYWLQRIPANQNGQPSSIGSIAHTRPQAKAKCKPCIFLSTAAGCAQGRECAFCHLTHKFRMCKAKRERNRRLLERYERYADNA
eukprot:s1718_g12.t1